MPFWLWWKARGAMAEDAQDERSNTVCIIGLGYVGLTLAVAMAEAGYRIYGVEKSVNIRNCVAAGRAHFSEQGLDAALARHVAEGNITCSDSLPPAGVAATFIATVGTPLKPVGMVDLTSFQAVLNMISHVLTDGDCVILRSTVKVGTSRSIAKRILDRTGKSYTLAYCPERTLEGRALHELTHLPQIVGGADAASVARASAVFARFAPRIITVDSLEAAEMVKLLNNTQRDLSFAFANEVAEMCEAARISATDVIRAACEDYPRSRIEMPGPVGGPCLEKDPHILAEGLEELGYVPGISLAGRRLNERLPRTSVDRIARWFEARGEGAFSEEGKVAILGLAFKGQPETNDLRGTMATPILTACRTHWPLAHYTAYDPIVAHAAFNQFDVSVAQTLEEAFEGAQLVLIQNNHTVFSAMQIEALSAHMASPGLIFDYWNLYDPAELSLKQGVLYGGLGTLESASRAAV